MGEKIFTALIKRTIYDYFTMRHISPLQKQGYRDFDLPVEHLMAERHYVPPRTHDPAETMRRRDLNPGTLLREMQLRGITVARTILDTITEEEGRRYATEILGIAGLNTAWYSYAHNRTDVMRRRLKLPLMTHPRSRGHEMVYEDATEMLSKAEAKAKLLVEAHEYIPEKIAMRQKDVGVTVGNTALHLLLYVPVLDGVFPVPYPDEDEILPREEDMQSTARAIALSGLSRARTIHREIGAHPSIAQLADPYSHLNVYWHRHAPGSAQSALRDALAV